MKTVDPCSLASRGICATCVEGPSCVLASCGPVHSCDAFHTAAAPRPILRKGKALRGGTATPVSAGHGLGLCVNCDHRGSCELPGRVSGVWHCETYA